MARTGYVAKGGVYGLTGILTCLAAFNLGGEKADQLQVLEFLQKQTFGNLLLILLGLGLACYGTWRFIQSIKDPEGIGNDKKASIKRVAYFTSGCIYTGLAVLAFWRAIAGNSPDSGNGGNGDAFLGSNTGLIVLGITGVVILCVGIFQFIRIYKGTFLKKFNFNNMEKKQQNMVKNSAYTGMASRGIIFLIIGYFAAHAAFTATPSEIKTTMDAFSFLEEFSFGSWILGLVAAGLAGYAFYMFLMAKYRNFRDGGSSNS